LVPIIEFPVAKGDPMDEWFVILPTRADPPPESISAVREPTRKHEIAKRDFIRHYRIEKLIVINL
jgi:hypothetical protein